MHDKSYNTSCTSPIVIAQSQRIRKDVIYRRNSRALCLYSAVRLIQQCASQITHKQHILAYGSASNREHWYRDAPLQSASKQNKEVTGLEDQDEQKEQEEEAHPPTTSNDSVVGRLVGEVGQIGRWAIDEGHTNAGTQFT